MKKYFAICIAAVLVGWFCYFYFVEYPTIYYRFKLTVEVQTPDGVKSGSVVNEEAYTFSYIGKEFLPSQGGGVTCAEALFVDLGHGKNLIVTLYYDPKWQSGTPHSLDMAAIGQGFCSGCLGDPALFRKALSTAPLRGPFPVDIRKLPNLVTLTDINDIKTMQHVAPTEVAAALGTGYEIKSASFEIVEEPLTEKIEQEIKWLVSHAKDRSAFDGSQSAGANSNIFSTLGYVSFKWHSK